MHPLNSPSPLWEFLENLRVVLGLEARPRIPHRRTPSDIGYVELGRGSRPARGLLYSFLLHEVAIFLILFLPVSLRPERRFRVSEEWRPVDMKLTYLLPAIGGGRSGGGRPPRRPGGGSPKKESSPPPAPSGTKGLVYPGPQPIVSNPPNPTNRLQTILQPDLVNPPTLKVPLRVPNLVTLARRTTPMPPPLVPKVALKPLTPAAPPEAPRLRADLRAPTLPYSLPLPPAPPPSETPKLRLPPSAPESTGPLQAAVPQPPEPTPEPGQAFGGLPEPPGSLPVPGLGGTDSRTLLALSPIPGPPEQAVNIPPGEARGQFAIGPEPNLTGPSSQPGTGSGSGAGTASGIGSGSGVSGVSSVGGIGTGTGTGGEGGGGGSAGGGGGTGTDTGPASGSGFGPGTGTGGGGQGGSGTGSGTGVGSGVGPGQGYGTGQGSGTGSGSGIGSGSGPFPAISIIGGSVTSGVASPPAGARRPVQPGPRPTYGMTIASTASSGGGLRDYGVFRNEAVFTVYVEMTHSTTPAPSWTLQYALLRRPSAKPPAASPKPNPGSLRMQDQVLAPFPITKETPQFPSEIVARNLLRMIVVYAEITSEGKMQNTRIIQSPNPLLNQPLLEALEKWTFRPAEVNGEPASVKALLGIPLALPHQP